MATLVEERYKVVCELQESSRLRNEQMMRDAVRLRNIFAPVNTERLENLKSKLLKVFTVTETHPSASYPFNHPSVSLLSQDPINDDDANDPHYDDMITEPSLHTNTTTMLTSTTITTLADVRATIPIVSPINLPDARINYDNTSMTQSSSSSLANSINTNCSHTISHMPVSNLSLQLPSALLQREFQADGKQKGPSSPPLLNSEIMESIPIVNPAAISEKDKTANGVLLQTTNPIQPRIGTIRLNTSDSEDEVIVQNEDYQLDIKPTMNDSVDENLITMDIPVQVMKIDDKEEDKVCSDNEKDNNLLHPVKKEIKEDKGSTSSLVSASSKENDNEVGKRSDDEGTMSEHHRAIKKSVIVAAEITAGNQQGTMDSQIDGKEGLNKEDDFEIKENGGNLNIGVSASVRVEFESDCEQSEDSRSDSPKAIMTDNNQKQKMEDNHSSTSSSSSSTDMQPAKKKDYAHVVSVIINTINSNIGKERELAQQLYTQPNLTDDMRDKIQDSPVLNSLLIKRAEYGQDISTWDTSALSSVLIKTLSNFKDMHGTPSIQDLTNADCVWYSIWLNLLDHIRLLFQCGKELESITEVFSITLGINKAKLFDVFQQECGIDPSTQHDFTESTLSDPSSSSTVSSSLHNNNNNGAVGVTGEAYKSFAQSLLQSSHNSEHVSSSFSEDSDIAALQSFKPSLNDRDQQHVADNTTDEKTDTDIDFNNSLSLPLTDSSPKHKKKPVLDEAAIKRRMGVMDDAYSEESQISVPPVNDDDDGFDFYD